MAEMKKQIEAKAKMRPEGEAKIAEFEARRKQQIEGVN